VVDLLSSFALRWVRIRSLPSMWYFALFRYDDDDDSMILIYLCVLLFSLLFHVSFNKLFLLVLLVLYRVAD
jgi:hypothetical protein